jgi:hypothetical protein
MIVTFGGEAAYRLDKNTFCDSDTARSLAEASGMADQGRHDDCVVAMTRDDSFIGDSSLRSE